MKITDTPKWVLDILACPWCKQPLKETADSHQTCDVCGIKFPLGPAKQPDLRLAGALETLLPTKYDPTRVEIPETLWDLPTDVAAYTNRAKQLDGRPETDMKSWLLSSIKPGNIVLDLGSKSNRDKKFVEGLGAKYIAIEINAVDAMLLGDAHAIPLLDKSVDVVMCMSVFEHLKNPFLAAQEIRRVLKPHCRLIGIVGFLEAIHGLPHGSYFHHSYFGIYTVLSATGFQVNYLAVSPKWLAIHSISRAMLLGLPKRLIRLITWPLEGMQNCLWYAFGLKSGNVAKARLKKNRILSASVHFVASSN